MNVNDEYKNTNAIMMCLITPQLTVITSNKITFINLSTFVGSFKNFMHLFNTWNMEYTTLTIFLQFCNVAWRLHNTEKMKHISVASVNQKSINK
jgi:heme O synthase-like polyprenyltransferase